MAELPNATNVQSFQMSEEDIKMPCFDTLAGIFQEPPGKRFAALNESQLDEIVRERHSRNAKEVTN